MTDHEQAWDQRLRIRTAGRDDQKADQYHHPYEPTPYSVLERLADSGFFAETDTLLDYGCGKGRVGLFLAHQTRAKAIGIEYDDRIYADALENQKNAGSNVEFLLTRAESYPLPPQVNRCYFFNPFSAEILHKVMARILDSWYEDPREIFLFFYYPDDAYIAYLMTVEELEFYDEIPCDDLFPGDPRERVLIFQLPDIEEAYHLFENKLDGVIKVAITPDQ